MGSSSLDLQDQLAIVTGGGSGIGRGIAERFAAAGARVIVVGRTDRATETVSAIENAGGQAAWIPTDISVEDDVRKMVESVVDGYGVPDILVNNAAVQFEKLLWDLSVNEFDTMLHTNLRGYFLCSKYVIPRMIENGGGSILNISSNLAFRGLKEFAGYSTTKGGIVAMSRAMAVECAPHGIRVNCICPGTVRTPIMDPILSRFSDPEEVLRSVAESTPAGRIGQPEDIAALALFLASAESTYILGASVVIDGGASIGLGRSS